MIQDDALAKEALSLIENANGLLTKSLALVKENPPESTRNFGTRWLKSLVGCSSS
jgi:hypothetical protein